MSSEEAGFAPPETTKEVVIYRGGWGFRLAARHDIRLNLEHRLVGLHIPDRGATYHLEAIDETDDEYRIHVGRPFGIGHGDPAEYPFPTIDVELNRLRNEWMRLGGTAEEFNAWGAGDDYDSKTYGARRAIRERRGGA